MPSGESILDSPFLFSKMSQERLYLNRLHSLGIEKTYRTYETASRLLKIFGQDLAGIQYDEAIHKDALPVALNMVSNLEESEIESFSEFKKTKDPILSLAGMAVAIEDDEFKKWLDGQNILQLFSRALKSHEKKQGFLAYPEVNQIIGHPNSEEFFKLLTPRDVCELLYKSVPHRKVIQVSDLLNFPHLARISAEASMTKGKTADWANTLELLDTYGEAAGRQEVSPQVLNDVVEKLYAKDFSDCSTVGEKEKLRRSILNTLEIQKTLPKIVRAISSSRPTFEKMTRHEDWLARIDEDEIKEAEDISHPLAHLKAKMGIEVEHLSRLNKGEFKLMQPLGISLGLGGTVVTEDATKEYDEFAPGVFLSHKTVNLLIPKLIDQGYINVNSEVHQSVHLDMGVPYRDGAFELMRFLQATGYLYLPLPNKKNSHSQTYPRIWAKHSRGEGDFIDIKEFTLQSQEAFQKGTPIAFAGSTAMMHFQNIIDLRYPERTPKKVRTDEYADTTETFMLSETEKMGISKSLVNKFYKQNKLTVEQKSFACLYIDLLSEVHGVFRERGYKGILLHSCPEYQVKAFIEELKFVLPDYWANYDVDPAQVEYIPFDVTNADGEKQRYSNIVHYARERGQKLTEDYNKLLANAEGRFVSTLKACVTKTGPNQEGLVNFLFKNFPSGLSAKSTMEEKMKRLEELKERYL